MPSVHSRPVIESDGNNLALRRVIRLIKKLINKVTDIIIEGGLVTEEILDAIGGAVVQLFGLLGYPFKYFLCMPEIFTVFTGKPLPMTLPLIFVFHIILLIYSTYVLCYMPAVGMSIFSTESITFHIITALAIISYYRAVTTDPGSIPKTAEWEKENTAKKQEGLRFCNREKKWKPDRAHYCSAIGRNVLKMDHYCPWLANCVGYFNHKFFILFIIYATVASGWSTISVAHLLATNSAGLLKSHALSAAQIFFLSEGICLSSLISLILTPFTGFHFWLVARNKTTLEYCEKTNASITYDFGLVHNFSQVFGYNPLFWLLPIQTAPADGLKFNRRSVGEEAIPVTLADGSDDEEERVKREIEEKVGLSARGSYSQQHSCCIRRWDVPSDDSPLFSTGDGKGGLWESFVGRCGELNGFRERLQSGFTNILSRDSSPSETPRSKPLAVPVVDPDTPQISGTMPLLETPPMPPV